ncbi:uncharacterized protein si:ch211-158d24.4 [Silurus meridionalis]|uniref:THD domain-containing protein n=1 Tax=Silurus meridionalis TaxID=175797 RepID=A0A8T0ASY4_SILME|nr:uncharacterized protein si:ch211-158d24.4 [Silurus meridionalis]KAF7694859.1 hypothetical protein HF521_006582 [Silurus meridionalis]KAI5094657.1 hypothetical protein C0J45_14732 [Silurus meridionalis]
MEANGNSRTDAREVRDSYTMLVESDAFARENNRALRRDLCVSRVIILALLMTHTAFCVLLYIQPASGEKNKETLKESLHLAQKDKGTNYIQNPDDYCSPPLLALVAVEPNRTSGKFYMRNINIRLEDFQLGDSNQSLLIPCDGKYRLGLQLMYSRKDDNEDCISLDQNIFKNSPSYEDKDLLVLSAADTFCCKGKQLCHKSIYSETISVFSMGDKIRVESNNIRLIDHGGQPGTKNFFTLQLISKI